MLKVMWRPEFASIYKGVNPEVVAQEIINIGDSATPAQIVDAARNEASELHKCFEWDDAVAAEQYRQQQARTLTHHLVIERDNPEDADKPPIRFFVAPKNGAGYKPIEVVYRNIDEHDQLLQKAYGELRAFKRKYASLSELQEIFDLIA